MSDHIGKELAAREIAKALSKLSLDELKKVAAKYDVDITDALEGEYFTKADLVDETESLTAIAMRLGHPALIDVAKKMDALFVRTNDVDKRFADVAKRAADDPLAKLTAIFDKQDAINKRRAEDEAILGEYRATGVRPLAMWQREGAERHRYLNSGRDE